ncbi:MAG: transcription-repair coupling factor [Planctomycetota bacterium]|nr:transcription-repair coupling factor [Planctomycetota bacterium]
MAGPLEALLARERAARVGGLHGGALGLVLAHLSARSPLLAVFADPKSVDAVRLDLETQGHAPALPFPTWPRSERGGTPDAEVLQGRATVLQRLRRWRAPEHAPVVLTTLAALVQRVPAVDVIEAAVVDLTPGDERALPPLLEHLAAAGYARVGAVETPGEFASRGGLLDVWPWGAPGPSRVDFFGDEIESVSALDPATQRSGGAEPYVSVMALPAERFADPHGGEGAAFLLEHLPPTARVVLVEREALIGAATSVRMGGASGERADVARLERDLNARPVIVASALPFGESDALDVDVGGVDVLCGVALRSRAEATETRERTARIAQGFQELARRVERIVVYRRAEGEEERLRELFAEHEPGVPVTFAEGSLSRSFIWRATGTAHVAYDDLADLPLRERRARGVGVRSRPIQDFLELVEGAPVVHLHHGIGMYRGLVELENQGETGEYLQIEFAEGTIVYVPVARIDLVQRYIGTGRRPRLSKLGGQEWAKRKAKVSAAVEELAERLLATQAARARRQGPAMPPDTEWQREFEEAFPHRPTPDQAAAVRAIKEDLEGDRPMDRLLCGDVGYGKTEVALRAMFKAIASGRQAAVLVPTKVLAEQHVRVFTQRLAPYPLAVRALSGLKSSAENRAVIAGLKGGTVDLVIGTHRLLSKDVGFARLGLVVIDEEQRFGVKHKERLKEMRSEVDVLSLSATPIPRTLHMALLGIRDISNLTTPPLGRHPIETIVARESDEIVRDAIRRELARGGQVFMVSSRIRELPMIAARLQDLVPKLRVGVVHGKMDKDLVEKRMLRFVRGELDLLLATTIIESGLDIPNANTIILRDADRYGLSELHQLRGRVGRERRKAHALVLMPQGRPLNEEAAQRLRAIEEYSELGAGFRIAMRDLEIRGAGNLLGPQQSGHIASVGYDLFCKLLAEAVELARGHGERPSEPAFLGIDLPAGIPDRYVEDAREKFRVFRRVAAAASVAELAALEAELVDRFGPAPKPVRRLLLCQRVRIVAGEAGIARIAPGPSDQPGVLLHAPTRILDGLMRRLRRLRRVTPGSVFLPAPGTTSDAETLNRLLDLLAEDRA